MKTLHVPQILAVLLVVSLALMTTGIQIVAAAPPQQFSLHYDDTQTLNVCDFPIVQHLVGTLHGQDHIDASGNFVFENLIFSDWRVTFANPTNGKTVSSVRAYNEQFTQYSDGSSRLISAGLVSHLVIPGLGEAVANVGNILVRFDPSGELTSILIAGEHDGPIVQFVCPYLAQ